MAHLSVGGLLLRFIFGGLAVVLCTVVGTKLGDRMGGIFAAFPAVFLAALLTAKLDYAGKELVRHSITLSQGAVIGMVINICMAILAGFLLKRQGWKKGLASALLCWCALSVISVLFI
ncbi:DUF3147 family protein [Bacillus sp. 1P06AnD]|uniref:DUF3147 family protein n=1 Tax=Bacillus sp. 1P06AnD TaxID=3132208 RepID=UPI0039A1ABD3